MTGSTASMPSPSGHRPYRPWLPARLRVWGVYPRERTVQVRNARTGASEPKARKRFDVRFRVDGREFRYGFDQKGWADDFALSLQRDFSQGRLFDPQARRFLPPPDPAAGGAAPLTFVEHARDYFARQWHRWEPSTRRTGQRNLAYASIFLVRDETPALEGEQRLAADRYLRAAVFTVSAAAAVHDAERDWVAWFEKWSLPLDEVTDEHLRILVDRYRTQYLDGRQRNAAASTVARMRADVRAAFTNARKRRLIDWDPWDAVEREQLRDDDKVDPDLVMDPDEVRKLACRCGEVDGRYECCVLIQGFCGLRPGEATEVRRRDLDLTEGREAVTVGGTRSEVPVRFFDAGQGRRRPLKGRGPKARRTVPIPTELAALLRTHLDAYVEHRRDAYVFTTVRGRRINSSNFHRDVWEPARADVFEPNSPLRRVGRGDLRHSAITLWLNAGVPLKTAQRWSGHKTLAVLLDTYLGVMKGDEVLARQRFEDVLRPSADDDSVTGS